MVTHMSFNDHQDTVLFRLHCYYCILLVPVFEKTWSATQKT